MNVTPRKQPPRPASAPAGVTSIPVTTGNVTPAITGPPATTTVTTTVAAPPPRPSMTPTTGSNVPGTSGASQPALGQVVPPATDPLSATAVRTPIISQVKNIS